MSDTNELISFIASMSGEGNLRVEENLGEGFVRLRVSEAERRQAKHDIQHVEDIVIEMLRNARDAGATRIYVATFKEEGMRSLLFLDNGCGVPEDMRERIFDARVTSKLESMKMDRWGVHGRGMALFSIRQNVDDVEVVASGKDLGSSFKVLVNTDVLNERADQSSWPIASKDETGAYHCARGPHNILRTVCDFSLVEMHGCDVFIGSPTEIAATLYSHARGELDASRLLFLDNESTLPVTTRLGFAADAAEFMRIAETIGIDISERTAHRILSGAIAPLRSALSRLLRERDGNALRSNEVDLVKDRRGLKIAPDDLSRFSRDVERCFEDLAQRYYLNMAGDPKIRVMKDRITVSFPIEKGE